MSACNRSVLLRFRHHVEHASLCYAHRVAQSHLAGISLSCMGRHVTVGGFEPTSGRSTANLACLRCLYMQHKCMRIKTAALTSMHVRLYEPQMCECTPQNFCCHCEIMTKKSAQPTTCPTRGWADNQKSARLQYFIMIVFDFLKVYSR